MGFANELNPLYEKSSKLRHCRDQPVDVLRPRQAMVTVLHQGEHDVVAGEARRELDGVLPRHIRVLHPLEDANRAAGLGQAIEKQVMAALLDQPAGYRVGFFAIPRRPLPGGSNLLVLRYHAWFE